VTGRTIMTTIVAFLVAFVVYRLIDTKRTEAIGQILADAKSLVIPKDANDEHTKYFESLVERAHPLAMQSAYGGDPTQRKWSPDAPETYDDDRYLADLVAGMLTQSKEDLKSAPGADWKRAIEDLNAKLKAMRLLPSQP
jgi:hypothetical protein